MKPHDRSLIGALAVLLITSLILIIWAEMQP
jgi:hypothetical protein